MERARRIMTKEAMIGQTSVARGIAEDFFNRAREYEADGRKDARLARHECRACFYLRSRIGGAAMTSQPCGLCGKDQWHASTNTDALCMECAREHFLCRHCGGDFGMRPRRKNWPTPAEEK